MRFVGTCIVASVSRARTRARDGELVDVGILRRRACVAFASAGYRIAGCVTIRAGGGWG
jgi:hypothetical protein